MHLTRTLRKKMDRSPPVTNDIPDGADVETFGIEMPAPAAPACVADATRQSSGPTFSANFSIARIPSATES